MDFSKTFHEVDFEIILHKQYFSGFWKNILCRMSYFVNHHTYFEKLSSKRSSLCDINIFIQLSFSLWLMLLFMSSIWISQGLQIWLQHAFLRMPRLIKKRMFIQQHWVLKYFFFCEEKLKWVIFSGFKTPTSRFKF